MSQGDNVRPSVGEPNEHCFTRECLLDIPWIYHSHTFRVFTTPDLTALQADMKRATGAVRRDLELLKPFRMSAVRRSRQRRSNAQRLLTVYGWSMRIVSTTNVCNEQPFLSVTTCVCRMLLSNLSSDALHLFGSLLSGNPRSSCIPVSRSRQFTQRAWLAD